MIIRLNEWYYPDPFKTEDGYELREIFLNTDNIVCMFRDNGATTVYINSVRYTYILIKETPDEIMEMINDKS